MSKIRYFLRRKRYLFIRFLSSFFESEKKKIALERERANFAEYMRGYKDGSSISIKWMKEDGKLYNEGYIDGLSSLYSRTAKIIERGL